MFCPICGEEYRPGFSRCVDCEVDLAERPSGEDPALADAEPVLTTWDPAVLTQARALLDEARVPYTLRSAKPRGLSIADRLGTGPRPTAVLVGEEMRQEATEILHPLQPDGSDGTDGEPEGDLNPEAKMAAWPEVPAGTSRRLRAWELGLVLFVSFGSNVVFSFWELAAGATGTSAASAGGAIASLLRAAASLALLAYVLFRRGQTLRDLGLTFQWLDLPVGILLLVADTLIEAIARRLVGWHAIAHDSTRLHLVGVTVITLNALEAVIEPVREELISRAFTITEVAALTGSTALAIAASTVLQTSYHLYQGLPNAIVDGAGFLLFSIFYARFRRATPLILAHAGWDLLWVLHHA